MATKQRMFRLSDEAMAQLRLVREALGLASDVEAIRYLVKREADRITRQAERRAREIPGEIPG